MFRTIVAAALTTVLLGGSVTAAGEVVVIVNPANPAAALDAKQVKNHYLKLSPTWGNGEKVRPIDQAGADEGRTAFMGKVLGMKAADFERFWIEKQYASAENPPTKAPDDAGVIKLVKTFKGGIGFVSKEAAVAAGADVKIVHTVAY